MLLLLLLLLLLLPCLQVVDRVLLQSGSKTWWAALVGRGKMQRAWNQHTTLNIVSSIYTAINNMP
jgi:hypothetical protein